MLEPVTKVPRRGSERTIPSVAIRCSSRLTVFVLEPNSEASFRHDGRRSPGCQTPSRMRRTSSPRTCSPLTDDRILGAFGAGALTVSSIGRAWRGRGAGQRFSYQPSQHPSDARRRPVMEPDRRSQLARMSQMCNTVTNSKPVVQYYCTDPSSSATVRRQSHHTKEEPDGQEALGTAGRTDGHDDARRVLRRQRHSTRQRPAGVRTPKRAHPKRAHPKRAHPKRAHPKTTRQLRRRRTSCASPSSCRDQPTTRASTSSRSRLCRFWRRSSGPRLRTRSPPR